MLTLCLVLYRYVSLLALSGECGELCEIFQWMKDDRNDAWNVSPSKIQHIGEEISDVLVYSIRLADLTGIDLPAAVSVLEVCEGPSDWTNIIDSSGNWQERQLDVNNNAYDLQRTDMRQTRSELFHLLTHMGSLSNVFSKVGNHALSNITTDDKVCIAKALAGIYVSLSKVSNHVHISMSESVTHKITKNSKKYPKEIVKGSSAKYTEYLLQDVGGKAAPPDVLKTNCNSSCPKLNNMMGFYKITTGSLICFAGIILFAGFKRFHSK